MERLSGHEDYEELSNEPAFSKMVQEWKAYRSTGLSPADIPALTARAEAAEAERDAATGDWKVYEENGQCDVCKYGEGGGCVYPEGGRCHFEWRGKAGKGQSDGAE